MKKLGIGKKKEGDEESTRSALFGGRSKNKSPNPQTNPYANLPTQGDAYNQAKARAVVPGYEQRGPSPAPPSAPQGEYGSSDGYPAEKKGGYGGMNGYPDEKKGGYGRMGDRSHSNGGGYSADKYGAQSGYGGADRYGSGQSSGQTGGSRYGGYGGFGPTPDATDTNRDALFGGAKDRVQKQNNQQMGYGQPPSYDEGQSSDQQNGYGGGSSYEAYGDRQLTAEEEEEEDVQATKQQIKFIKQQDVSSTRNALRIAAQAEETG